MESRCYSELSKLKTFEERFDYLQLKGKVGVDTFGFDRYLNQRFYTSAEWKRARRDVIIRDNGCDLGVPGYELQNGIYVHHMNPISVEDLIHGETWIIDPEFLICVSYNTHQAIHYGDRSLLPKLPVERSMNDHCPWLQ
jgi:hypothetical protein